MLLRQKNVLYVFGRCCQEAAGAGGSLREREGETEHDCEAGRSLTIEDLAQHCLSKASRAVHGQ